LNTVSPCCCMFSPVLFMSHSTRRPSRNTQRCRPDLAISLYPSFLILTCCRTNSIGTMSTSSPPRGKSPPAWPRSDRTLNKQSSSVESVHPTHVVYTKRTRDEKTGADVITRHTIPSNFALWSTGIAMNPFTRRLCDLLPNQVHRKAIETDAHLRVKGAPLGTVYAIGDCATVRSPRRCARARACLN
jgi:hypothetical protein